VHDLISDDDVTDKNIMTVDSNSMTTAQMSTNYIDNLTIESLTTHMDHVSFTKSHVTSTEDHMITPGNHLMTPEDHMTTPGSYMTAPEDHVSVTEDHITTTEDHVITKDTNLQLDEHATTTTNAPSQG